MIEYQPRHSRDIVHTEQASVLSRQIIDDGVDLIGLATELLDPGFKDTFALRGYMETEHTTTSIPLQHAGLSVSSTYRSLLDRPYAFMDIKVSREVDAFHDSLVAANITLRNKANDNTAEIAALYDENGDLTAIIQQAASSALLADAAPQLIDELALEQLLKDFLLQTGYDPRDLSQEKTTDLAKLLLLRSVKTERTYELAYAPRLEHGASYELDFKHTTHIDKLRTLRRQVELSITGIQEIGAATSDAAYSAITKLKFEASTAGNETNPGIGAVVIAAVSGNDLWQYPEGSRQANLEAIFKKYGNPENFRVVVLQNLMRIASIQTFDFGSIYPPQS